MPASVRLGERKSGNMDISSLQRELDSLRGYRDVLHDTMKGLVAQAQGKMTPNETPELVQLLQQVAELLATFTANAKEASSQPQIKSPAADAAADKYDTLAREEAAREKVLREKAEAEIQRLERESTIAAENLATAEKQRDFATKQLSSQRLARKQLEAAHSLLGAEASALDAALSRLAASVSSGGRWVTCTTRKAGWSYATASRAWCAPTSSSARSRC